MSLPPTEWDAEAYHQISSPQLAWGLKVLDRLPLQGDETVLDAGCGSGRLSEKVLERLPRGRLIALDSSQNMLREAKATLQRFGDKVTFLRADLGALELDRVADAVFSTATFHWVLDHDALFAGLLRALKPGGLLVAQCGGGANLHAIHQRAGQLMHVPPFAEHYGKWKDPWHFAGAEETTARLERLGFESPRAWLEDAPTTFPDAPTFRRFIEGVILRVHLEHLPSPVLKAQYLDALVEQAERDAPPLTLDYVRLNIEARRPA
ncbi:MAG TPA: class I SAM-dependent methyltransferase [Myxococcales bacterium]|nr:class I SAM-dependent methyltransferase [Myxococcales bacterium]